MTLIKVKDGTYNRTERLGKMHKSRKVILDVLNGEYRKDTFGTYIPNQSEIDARELEEKSRREEISDALRITHSCPKCNRLFDKLDRKFYYRVGHCFNCQIHFETELRGMGLWLEYEEMKLIQNELSIFRDHKQKFEEALEGIKPYAEMVTDSGLINRFEISDEQIKQIKEDIQDDLNFIEEKTPIMMERLSSIIESLIKKDKTGIIEEHDSLFKRIKDEYVKEH